MKMIPWHFTTRMYSYFDKFLEQKSKQVLNHNNYNILKVGEQSGQCVPL